MPFPAILAKWAPTILGGLGLLSDRDDARSRFQSEAALQREFAQHGVRWRVEDAKAAGLHPLYALGANVPSYSPSFVQQSAPLSEMGQNVGRAIASTQTASQRRADELSLRLLESQIGETDARRDYYISEARRNGDPTQIGPSYPQGFPVEHVASQRIADAGVYPEEVAAMNPAWSRFNLGNGLHIRLPSSEGGGMSESIESLSESMLLMVMTYMENKRIFGSEWTEEFFRRYVPGGSAAIDTLRQVAAGVRGLIPGL